MEKIPYDQARRKHLIKYELRGQDAKRRKNRHPVSFDSFTTNDRHPVANSIFTPQFLLAEEVNYQITSGLPWQNDSEHLQKLNQERG